MLHGIGVDLLHRDTIGEGVLCPRDPFFRSAYTEREQEEGRARDDSAAYFRGRFAGKEAVFKALGLAPHQLKRWSDIEILADADGAPAVRLYGSARIAAEQKGVTRIDLSLSGDGDYHLAFCVASGEGGQPKPTGAESP